VCKAERVGRRVGASATGSSEPAKDEEQPNQEKGDQYRNLVNAREKKQRYSKKGGGPHTTAPLYSQHHTKKKNGVRRWGGD